MAATTESLMGRIKDSLPSLFSGMGIVCMLDWLHFCYWSPRQMVPRGLIPSSDVFKSVLWFRVAPWRGGQVMQTSTRYLKRGFRT